jgi:hypothetical protein
LIPISIHSTTRETVARIVATISRVRVWAVSIILCAPSMFRSDVEIMRGDGVT